MEEASVVLNFVLLLDDVFFSVFFVIRGQDQVMVKQWRLR